MVICVIDGKRENNPAEQLVKLGLCLVSYCLHVPRNVEVVHVIAVTVSQQRHRGDVPNTCPGLRPVKPPREQHCSRPNMGQLMLGHGDAGGRG